LGSLERFIGILIEHCGGDFPLWLAPTQLRIITVNDSILGYGLEVAKAFDARGIRVQVDERSEKLGFKIRDAELHKVPIVAVLGQKEQDARTVSLRWRKKGDAGQESLDQAIQTVLEAAAVPTPGETLLGRVDRGFGLT
jgi:threonyl-tRNA synthetase